MIPSRLEKLKFLVEEMHIAFHLATHAPDAFVARTLARHILIGAKSFIEHARRLKKPLIAAGFDARHFHKTKEAYAGNFDEYFQVSRDRLGAHVQDFDFGKRIELWNDIEIVKIGFFVDGAKEIYQILSTLSLPGYVSYSDPPELTDEGLNETLREFALSADKGQWVEIGVDPLAMTRERTTAALNLTPVHSRAGQLVLIRRWLKIQSDLIDKLVMHPRVVRILKARIITDIVSYCDCLVTRVVPSGAPQEMDGLDALLSASGASPTPIANFVSASNFDVELAALRDIRDVIGAHLEIDPARTLLTLITDLDSYDLGRGRQFFALVVSAFTKTCFSIIYLRMYAADGQRMYGITTTGSAPSVPFSGESSITPIEQPPMPQVNSEDAYRHYLPLWLDGDEMQRGEARQFFYNAFSASEVVEQIEEQENFSGGNRISRHEFRKAHHFVASTLSGGLSDADFCGILDLILACRNGYPYPLAEILVRCGRTETEIRKWHICYTLGEIASWPHVSVNEFLHASVKSVKWGLRLQATLAIFKTFVKSEGLYRTNNNGRTKADYGLFVESLMSSMNVPERLLCSLAFAGILSGPGMGVLAKPFAADYSSLQAQIETLCTPYLKDDSSNSKAATLRQLINTHDYVGICMLAAIDLEDDARKELRGLREELLDECCNGLIGAAAHDQAVRHLAICFLMKKEYKKSLEIAESIAIRNPEWVDAQILVVQIMAEMLASEDVVTRKITNLRRLYKLDSRSEGMLAALEQEIVKRKSLPATLV